MCERYVLSDQAAAEREFLPDVAWWKFAPRFNVSAQQSVPAVRQHQNSTEGVMLRWGFIPSWAERQPAGPPKIAVARDRIERSKTYRQAWVGGQRCILPSMGFYVWQLTAAGHRQPYFLGLTERALFGIAALWDRWVSEEDDVIESCSLVTVAANDLLSGLLGPDHEMPAILRRKDYALWLRGTPEQAKAVLRPYQPQSMHAHAVSPRINSIGVDDPSLILPVG